MPDAPITSSSQEHLPIADIIDDVMIYKDGGAAIVLEATSLNFGLLSEKEQEAVIFAYAGLLNSLSFSIQIVVRSQRKDISEYMKYLDNQMSNIRNPKLMAIAQSYRRFIVDSIKKKNVLGKKFYIAIPFSPLELGVTKSFLSTARVRQTLPFAKSYVVKKAKIILYPRRDHLIRQAGRFGIKLSALNKNEIVDLFWNIYNQEPPATKKDNQLTTQGQK